MPVRKLGSQHWFRMTHFPVVAFGVREGSCSSEACGDDLATLPEMVAASCM